MANISKRNRSNLDAILKKVFSVDTEAGYKLRYIITKALVCSGFKEEIHFLPDALELDQIMYWANTPEGHNYWAGVNRLKRGRK